jgi:hypothetical protein
MVAGFILAGRLSGFSQTLLSIVNAQMIAMDM